MYGYLIRRLIGAVVVMFAVAVLVFFMLRLLPGDPIQTMLFDMGDADAVDRLKAKYGLDQPVLVQLWKWLGRVLVGDLGNSIYGSRARVWGRVREVRIGGRAAFGGERVLAEPGSGRNVA